MGAYASSDPITPFHVQPVFLKSVPEKPEKPNGGQQAPSVPAGGMFGSGDFAWWHLLALPVFAVLYFLVEQNRALAGVSILVLFGCLFYRLDPARRRLALAPMSFATLLLVRRVVTYALAATAPVFKGDGNLDSALGWLPLFFAVTIFYMPRKLSYSGNFFVAGAVLLLASGLLPGQGFVAIFTATQYFLFIALIIMLAVDFSRPASNPSPS